MKQQLKVKQNRNSEKEEEKKARKGFRCVGLGLRKGQGLGGGRSLCLGCTQLRGLGGWALAQCSTRRPSVLLALEGGGPGPGPQQAHWA